MQTVLPNRRAGLLWAAGLVVLGLMLVVAQVARGPLDDPDPAFQRPGLLDLGELPQRAPALPAAVYGPSPTLVVFERVERLSALCAAMEGDPVPDATVVVVTPTAPPGCGRFPIVVAPDLAERFGMRTPVDGGFPVGYALVDAAGMTRYRTLDPDMASLLPEVRTMVAAVADG